VNVENAENRPSGAKARCFYHQFTARLKLCPFKAGVTPQAANHEFGSHTIYGTAEAVPFQGRSYTTGC
jgi:hypothetical protein